MSKSNKQQMFDAILQWQQSSLTQKAWCHQNNIAYSSFHYWYKRFRSQHLDKEQGMADRFVQVMVQDRQGSNPWCELAMSNGTKLLFHQPIAAEFIRSLID